MSNKLVTMTEVARRIREAEAKSAKVAKKDYNTVGVRFIYGKEPDRVYTYRVRKGVKLRLGELVVTPGAIKYDVSNDAVDRRIYPAVAVVVEVHTTPRDTGPYDYKFLESRVVAL